MPTSLLAWRRNIMLAALVVAGACTADQLVAPRMTPAAPAAATLPAGAGPIVISQVYGGGGNSGATLKNDFIELYNAGTVDVDLAGWSVQYASSTGTTWQVTSLTGVIPAGRYFLIQQAAGTGGSVFLVPDATGTISMGGSAGKVALLTTTVSLAGSAAGAAPYGGTTCPNNASVASIVDFVGYGSGTNCFEGGVTGPTGTVSATNAALRKANGAQDTNNNAADFEVAVAAPRNSGTAPVNNPVATIAPANPSAEIGATTMFTVSATLNSQPLAITSKAWSSSNTSVATIDAATGEAAALASGNTTITVTVQTSSGPATATTTLNVAAVLAPAAPGLVISQVYGGGGNSGTTYRNDYIELYNGGTATVNLAGWSVQYSSATASTWTRTPLSGTIEPGRYFLIQQAAGAGGTTALPSPDLLSGNDSLFLSATAGKIALVRTASPLSVACPVSDPAVADLVGYGSTANCSEGSPAANTSNTTAVFRKDGGRQDTDVNSADFTIAAPAPRNGGTTPLPPLSVLAAQISPANSAVLNGETVTYTATAAQFGSAVAVTSSAWTSTNAAVATIDPSSGIATATGLGSTTIGVTVTTANGTATTTTTLTVSAAPAAATVSPTTWTLKAGQTKTFTASAVDANGGPAGTTFTWTSSNPSVATIDASSGLATGLANGTVTITATTSNGVTATATLIVTVGNFSVQTRSDPLPAGFQTQFFVSGGGTDAQGAPVTNSTVTWSSSNPATLSVNATTGVVTAHAAGSTTLTATATTDGISSATTTVVTSTPTLAPAARVGFNTELGTPTDADPSDDVIIARRQYTLSYNASRSVPNWVSWNLDASHKGSAPRCNCFTADTALTRLGITAYETNDWINGGVWSRGHVSPSADWQSSDGDNAATFFLSNMIPQNQTANSGAWGDLENHLRTLAVGSTQVYIMAGPIFTNDRTAPGVDGFGFMNSTGRIAVPDSMWKVAIVVPDTRTASQIGAPGDVQVIAVNMANAATSTGSWTNYTTTIDRIQRSTGYDLLSALPEALQCRIEQRNCAPVARISGEGLAGGSEGQTLAFSAVTSSDADNDALAYSWSVNGQPAGTGAALSYTFANDGSFTVQLTADDARGGLHTVTSTVVVTNVAPGVAPFAGATIPEGAGYSAAGSFADPGSDEWTAIVNYGDGSGDQPLALSAGKTFSLSHTYADNGTYQVTVRVTETGGDAASGSYTATVTVDNVAPVVAAFAGATILRGEGYAAAGTFTDPGADTWTATVNYADGAGVTPLALTGMNFQLSHTYATAGSYTVAVQVTDKDGGVDTKTAQVIVQSSAQGLGVLSGQVAALTAQLNNGQINSLRAKLDAAEKSLEKGNVTPASNQVEAFINEVNAMENSGRLNAATAASLVEYARRILAAIA